MRYLRKDSSSRKSTLYETPAITIMEFPVDVITTSDPNEGEWDVEGVEQ